jgi:hypothetical protein
MNNLSATYSALGRHSDALAMGEAALEFRRRVLPEDHPDIGEGHVWRDIACGLWIAMACDLFILCDVQARR